LESFIRPGIPVHRIVGVLKKVGAFLNKEKSLLPDIEALFERLKFFHKFEVDIILDDKRQPAPQG
jgi:hypothetical protein